MKDLNAFIYFDEKARAAKKDGPLSGFTFGIKDNICTQGIPTTCGSKILKGYVPPYDATVVRKLKDAGAIICGKTNMDEFAMGSSNEHSAYGPVKNPHDITRIPGGSSGGSAVAVAAGLVDAALGSDTGGSIRQPAALTGVVGMKPTYGRVSRYGLVAFASSLDQIGPLTKNVTDCARVLNVISGHDPMDATSLNLPVPDYTKEIDKDINGLKIGLPKEYFIKELNGEIDSAIKDSIKKLEKEGAKFQEISLPHTKYALPTYYIIAPAECSANLARYDGVRYGMREKEVKDLTEMYEQTRTNGFGPEVMLRIIIGTYVLSSGYYDAYYKKASQVRRLITNDFHEAYKKVDVILTPTTPTTAFKIGEKLDDPIQMYLSDVFTIPCNLAGLPGISIPCGFDSNKLPIGMQFLGKHLDEATLIKVASAYEQL